MTEPGDLWMFLPLGYALSLLLETPVLLAGLSRPHSIGRRLWASVMLTACTYPIVVLVMPLLITPYFGQNVYIAVAETFAPLAECVLFYFAFDRKLLAEGSLIRPQFVQDMVAIVAANLTSWLVGVQIYERLVAWGWW
jgi:hypothetical protein